jgi:hypothetical protein
MKRFKVLTAVGSIALIGAMFVTSVNADEWNKKTVMTFSGPVEIPGVHLKGWGVLPAGTYVFKLQNSQSDRHIVQIFNKEETAIYATILAIPNFRLQSTDKTVVTFRERPAGQPEALRAWFYPGANWGEEFVYPKAKAAELAKVTKSPVLALQTDLAFEVAKPEEPAVLEALKQAPIVGIKPTGEVVQLAQVVQSPPLPTRVNAAPAPQLAAGLKELPATAGSLPLLGLLGLLALCGGVVLYPFVQNPS